MTNDWDGGVHEDAYRTWHCADDGQELDDAFSGGAHVLRCPACFAEYSADGRFLRSAP